MMMRFHCSAMIPTDSVQSLQWWAKKTWYHCLPIITDDGWILFNKELHHHWPIIEKNDSNLKIRGLFDVQSSQTTIAHQWCNKTWASPAVTVNGLHCNTEGLASTAMAFYNPQQSLIMACKHFSLGVLQSLCVVLMAAMRSIPSSPSAKRSNYRNPYTIRLKLTLHRFLFPLVKCLAQLMFSMLHCIFGAPTAYLLYFFLSKKICAYSLYFLPTTDGQIKACKLHYE